jgi:hypothetical protein
VRLVKKELECWLWKNELLVKGVQGTGLDDGG